jgi:hypothetical protein
MISCLAKLLLVSTSLAPVLLTLWFIKFSEKWDIKQGWVYLIIALALVILCKCILELAKIKLEKMPVKVDAIQTADKEIVGFILVYLLPFINQSTDAVNKPVLCFVGVLFFIVVWSTHAYHFNPLIGIGPYQYHFYEVTLDGGISYVLISKNTISNCKNVKTVVQLTEYMLLEV